MTRLTPPHQMPYSFLVSKEGTEYKARDKYGRVKFHGTDATTVVNNALNSLPSGRTWKEKVVLKGDFTINTPIKVPSYTILVIDGTITLANGSNCNMIENLDQTNGNRDIDIIGGILNGNKADQTSGSGIYFKATATNWAGPYCYRIRLKDVTVYNCDDYGFAFINCNDLFVTNCYSGVVGGPGNDLDGFYFEGCHEALVLGCHSTYNGRDGYRSDGNAITGAWENQFIGCASENNTGAAYHLMASAGDVAARAVVGCTCDDCANGVVVDGGRDITIASNDLTRGSAGVVVNTGNVVVAGNSITEAKIGVKVTADGVLVVGNQIRGKKEADEYGVYLDSGVDGCLIANNRITNISTNTGDQAGILLYGNNMYNSIVGNQIYDVARFGIRLAANAASSYNKISNNHICICATGIGINGAHTYNVITENYVRTAVYYGISLYSGADLNEIFHNVLEDCAGGAIGFSAAGANNKIKYNRGYVTENSGTATFNGDGTTTTFNIAHGLAGTPKSWNVLKASNIAQNIKYVTAGATNLIVTFDAAPPAGTGNVVLVWSAEM